MADELFDIRNALYLGNYHQVIAEGTGIKTTHRRADDIAAFNAERDSLVARAQVGLEQYDAVLREHRGAREPVLRAVRLWAELSQSIQQHNQGVVAGKNGAGGLASMTASNPAIAQVAKSLCDLAEETKGRAECSSCAVVAVAGLIATRDYDDALKVAHAMLSALPPLPPQREAVESRPHIELLSLMVDAYLRLNRDDIAAKEVKKMQEIDDEAVLTILSAGLVALRQGVEKQPRYEEAMQSFREVNARCGQSVMVCNLLAVALMALGRFEEAERQLLDALAKKSGDADTLANLAVVSLHLGKAPEATQRYVKQVMDSGSVAWGLQAWMMEERMKEATAQFMASR